MAEFTLRPKIDTEHSDTWGPNAVRSNPAKDWWEHIFDLDDDLYIWTPSINKLYTAGTYALIDENDLPSVSSSNGTMTSLTVYARGKVTDTGGSGIFEIYSALWPYASSPLEITEADGWIIHSYVFNIGAHNQLNELHDLEIGGGVRSKQANWNAKKYLDYVYCEIIYTPAAPSITWQWIRSLDEGNLAAFDADHMYSTYLKEWGFEIRLKSTQEIVKTITSTGRKLQGKGWDAELGYPDLEYATTYEARGYGETDDGKGVGAWVEFTTRVAPAVIINIKAERDSTQTSVKLYGEITEINDATILEKGFEYIIQDEEPEVEATGIEVIKERPAWVESWDVGEYWCYEYEGNDIGFWDRLYNLEENKIWWFRAYCKDTGDNKFTAPIWMKNVPSLTTFECTEVGAQEAKGNGELTDKGANIVTRRGFRIIKEYAGDLFGASQYRWDGFEGELEIESVHAENGVLIGFIWRGDLYRDSLHEDSGGYELGIYDKILGGGFLGEAFGIYLKPNDIYKVMAIAINQLGMGFGEEVDLATGIIILPSDPGEDEIISEVSAEKTIILGTIPDGCTVTRIGIRLGRTEGCTDIHVYENGSWTSGQSHTFYITGFVPGATYYKIPYIILNHGDYEEEILAIPDYRNPERLEEWLEDYPIEVFPEVEEEDEDELDQIIIDSSVGDISYRTIIREIKCERIGDQSFIDRFGRRRSKTISNHLIQSRANCIIIADDYVERFQILKLKIAIDYDIPIPFEREDVILLGDGKHKLREDGEGLIPCKDDGEGETLQEDFILAKIRKINSRFISGSETILSLELEV